MEPQEKDVEHNIMGLRKPYREILPALLFVFLFKSYTWEVIIYDLIFPVSLLAPTIPFIVILADSAMTILAQG